MDFRKLFRLSQIRVVKWIAYRRYPPVTKWLYVQIVERTYKEDSAYGWSALLIKLSHVCFSGEWLPVRSSSERYHPTSSVTTEKKIYAQAGTEKKTSAQADEVPFRLSSYRRIVDDGLGYSDLIKLISAGMSITTLPNGLRVVTKPMNRYEDSTVGLWIEFGRRFENEKTNGIGNFIQQMTRSSESELKKEFEKLVVKDHAGEVICDYLHAAAFQCSPLGRSILGSAKNMKLIKQEHLKDYITTNYTAPRVVVLAVGAFDLEKIVELLKKKFTNLSNDPTIGLQLVAKAPAVFTGSEISTV